MATALLQPNFKRLKLIHQRVQFRIPKLWERSLSSDLPDHRVDTVIVGGGAVGTSIAYHLSRMGQKDVVLLEKSELTAGSTWHAAGLTALYHPGINMKKLHYYSMNLFPQLAEETGQSLGFHRPGSIRLATEEERMREFHYQMQRQGWQPAPQKIILPDEIHSHFPLLNMNGIIGGLYNPYDGHIDPYSLTMAYAAGARKYGAKIVLNSPVTNMSLRSDGQWIVTTPNGEIVTKKVVNASGFWAHEIGKLTGLDLPLVPVEHQYMITKPIPEVQALKKEPPVLRHLKGSFYMRVERGGLLVGPYEGPSAMKVIKKWATEGVPKGFGKELFQGDLERLTPHLMTAMELVPQLEKVDVQTVVNGPIMYTPDLLPLLGPYMDLPNMWMAVGFGYGIIHSGGAGKYLADWMIKGEPPFDLVEADPNRFGEWTTQQYVFNKAAETYGMNNSYTYPKEERWAGRPTSRVSGAYEKAKQAGAEMSFHAGWEQPSFYRDPSDKTPGYQPSFYRSNWFECMKRECKSVMEGAGIIDLTPFGKFEVRGKDAAPFLDKMLANRLPKVGRTNISHLLTPSGKVYAELTVTRLAENEFFLVTGSGSELHDLRWLKDHARQWDSQVEFSNVTDALGCLSIAGPTSSDVLEILDTEGDFPFLSVKEVTVDGMPIRAIRISYTGELGWELYCKAQDTEILYTKLLEYGSPFGTYALNSLRLEKGFRMWGAEMNMDTNPIEAGLQPFIRMNKPVDFVGKSALENILREGVSRKLVFLKVDSEDVDPDGNETVWCSDKVVGNTTSGSYGCTVGYSVAFAYLPPFLAVPGTEVQVELMGTRWNAQVLSGPPVEIESVRNRKKMAK